MAIYSPKHRRKVQAYVWILISGMCICWYTWTIMESMHGLNNNNNNNNNNNTLPTQFTPPTLCFVVDYPFINQRLSFFPPTLPLWLFSYFSLLHRSEFLLSRGVSLQSYTDHHSPLHPTTRNNPIAWHHTTETFHLSHFSLHTIRIGTTGVSFGFLNLEDGPARLSRNVAKKLPLLTAEAWNHPQSFIYFLQKNPHIRNVQSTSVCYAGQTSHVRQILQLASDRKTQDSFRFIRRYEDLLQKNVGQFWW